MGSTVRGFDGCAFYWFDGSTGSSVAVQPVATDSTLAGFVGATPSTEPENPLNLANQHLSNPSNLSNRRTYPRASISMSAAAKSGIMSSWCPTSV